MALCLSSATAEPEVTALHLPELKFHKPPASRRSSVLHPVKMAHHVDNSPSTRWTAAKPAMLPLAYTLKPIMSHLMWQPNNHTVVANFLRFRDALDICEHVPCD